MTVTVQAGYADGMVGVAGVIIDGQKLASNEWRTFRYARGWDAYVDGEEAGFFPTLESVTEAARNNGAPWSVTAYIQTGDATKWRWHSTQMHTGDGNA